MDTGASFTGGAGDDTFTSTTTGTATTTTFTTGDSVVGGAGTDKLTVSISDSDDTSSALVATSGVEQLSIYNNDTAGYTVQGDLMDGLTDIYVTSGQSALTVDELNSTPNLHLVSTNQNATLAATTTTVAGTADAISITSNGAASSASITATFNGIETINLSGTGAATGSTTTALTIASTSLETVNVTGSTNMYVVADITGTDNAGEIAVFNASAATGNIDATITAGGSTELNVTMGSGDDVVTLGAMDKDYTVDGGAGTDRIETSAAGYDADLAALGELVGRGVTNVEVLGLTAGGSADLRAFPNNTFTSLYAVGSATFTGLPTTAASLIAAGSTGSLSLDRATDGTTDSASISLYPTTPGTYASINVADEETVTLSSSGIAAGSNTITTLTATDTTSLTISGNRDLTITNAITGTALATLDASGLVGQGVNLSVNASNSLAAMTVTAGAGSEASAGETMNTITTGSGADTVTGGEYKDIITTGIGHDSVVGGGGNDTITTSYGNDYVDGGAGDDTITDSVGNDTLLGGAGNDIISTAAGADSIDGGAGNDSLYVTTLGANDTIIGGTGTDSLSASAVSSTLAASFYSDVAESTALNITDVESAYIQVTTATAYTTTAPLNLDFTSVSGLSTLYLDTVAADGTAYKLTNFGGSSIILSELVAGQSPEFVNIDGADQAALSVSVRGFKPADADQADMTVTGVTALTISGDSYVSTSAQSNELGAVLANSADSVTISTTGTGGYAANANALLLESVSADNAQTLTISVGAADTLTSDGDIDTGNSLAQTVSVSTGENATLTITGGDLDLGSSAVNTLTVTNGIGGTISAMDIEASSAATTTMTLGASSTTTLDLNHTITSGTVTMSTASTWTVATLGKAATASSLTISGYGDIAEGTSIALAGSTFTFNAGSLTDSDGLTVTAAALTGAGTITGSTGADTITGGASGDTISGGNGADFLDADGDGAKEVQTITVGTVESAGNDVSISILGTTITYEAAAADVASTTANAAKIVTEIEASPIADLVTATSAAGVVTLTYLVSGNVAQATATGTDLAVTAATTSAGTASTIGGDDSVTGGLGADLILAGAGIDTVVLGTDTSADKVFFTDGQNELTTITGFEVNSDTLNFHGMANITGAEVSLAANAAENDPTDGSVIVFADGSDGTGTSSISDYTSLTEVATFLEASLSIAVSENFIVLVNDLAGDDVHIYNVGNDGTTAAIASTDLTYIGVVTNIGSTALDANDLG